MVMSDPIDTNPVYGWENITCQVIDNFNVEQVRLNVTYPDMHTENLTMTYGGGGLYYYNITFTNHGDYSYYIWANDINGYSSSSTVYGFSMPPNWDINNDGQCTVLDLTLLSNHYGETGQNGWIREDVDNNGVVQVLDLMVTGHYGESW